VHLQELRSVPARKGEGWHNLDGRIPCLYPVGCRLQNGPGLRSREFDIALSGFWAGTVRVSETDMGKTPTQGGGGGDAGSTAILCPGDEDFQLLRPLMGLSCSNLVSHAAGGVGNVAH
jgi:hypothetical protein